jgi:hypothetical protein
LFSLSMKGTFPWVSNSVLRAAATQPPFTAVDEIKSGEEGHRLRETVAQWLHRFRQVTVDLSQVRYMDSGGLGILVSLYPIARTAGATLKYGILSP